MRRGFVVGALSGALLALGLGAAIALVPTTPTWALWQIKSALDRNDLPALRGMVDFPALAARALAELADGGETRGPAGGGKAGGTGGPASEPGLDLREAAFALLSGGKLLTVFNDPDRPLKLGARDFFAAWWSMRREGDVARLSMDASGREVSLVLERDSSGQWRIVGVTPLSALIRVKPPEKHTAVNAPRRLPA